MLQHAHVDIRRMDAINSGTTEHNSTLWEARGAAFWCSVAITRLRQSMRSGCEKLVAVQVVSFVVTTGPRHSMTGPHLPAVAHLQSSKPHSLHLQSPR